VAWPPAAATVARTSGPCASFAAGKPRLSGGGITSLSWDRNDDLWVTQGGSIYELPSGGKAVEVEFGQTVKWDGHQVTEIFAFWDSALQAQQVGLP